MLDWLGRTRRRGAETWDDWRGSFLTKDGEPRALRTLVNDKLARTSPELAAALVASRQRILAVEESGAPRVAPALGRAADARAPVAEAYARAQAAARRSSTTPT